jgi:hypothetical protein
MSKGVSRQRGRRGKAAMTPASAAAGDATPGEQSSGGLRETLLVSLGGLAAAPLIGVLAGFLLLFGGIFLAIAWMIGPQAYIDSLRYAVYTGHTGGHIVDSWAALEFDPSDLPAGKLRWQPYAKISSCVVVEFTGDWSAPLQRGYCGNRFTFSDSFRLDVLDEMAPGVPFAFLRDANGFAVTEVRMSKAAHDWLSAHPPHDTFLLSKPPPKTALAELHEQFDNPLDVAIASWTTPFPPYPLVFDPQHPDQALPAALVADLRSAFWRGPWFFALLLAVPGFFVWRAGMNVLTGQTGPLLWVLAILPLLALPWWGDVLPRLLRHANSDWAAIATGMLDDITRVTRFSDGAPSDALFADGERMVWHADQGMYADSFGRIRFTPPQTMPNSADGALALLRAQASAQVRTFDAATQKTLFERLRQQYEANARGVQKLFRQAAEDVLRDAGSDRSAHLAARRFLIFGSGATYYDDQLDKIEQGSSAASESRPADRGATGTSKRQ